MNYTLLQDQNDAWLIRIHFHFADVCALTVSMPFNFAKFWHSLDTKVTLTTINLISDAFKTWFEGSSTASSCFSLCRVCQSCPDVDTCTSILVSTTSEFWQQTSSSVSWFDWYTFLTFYTEKNTSVLWECACSHLLPGGIYDYKLLQTWLGIYIRSGVEQLDHKVARCGAVCKVALESRWWVQVIIYANKTNGTFVNDSS